MNNETTAAGLACLQTQRQGGIHRLEGVAELLADQRAVTLDEDTAELQLLAEVCGTTRTTPQQEQSNIQVAKKRLIDAQNQQKLHLEELKSATALVSMAMKQKSFAQSRVDTSTTEVENAKKLLHTLTSSSNKKRGRNDDDEKEGNKKPTSQNTPASTNVDINNKDVDEVEGCTKELFRGVDDLEGLDFSRDEVNRIVNSGWKD